MTVDITTGGKKVYSNGSFITFDEKPSKIVIKRGKESVSFEFHFLDDHQEKADFEFNVNKSADELAIIVKLKNFNNQLGMGFTNPVSVAKFDNGDKIYMNVWVTRLGNQSAIKKLSYTIYVEEL